MAATGLWGREAEQVLLDKVSAGRHELVVRSLTALLEHRLKKLDARLRKCAEGEFIALQAQAQTLESLIAELTQP